MINDPVPSSLLLPGVYTSMSFVDDVSGITPQPRIVVVLAEAKGGTAPVDVPTELFGDSDADAKLGMGTFSALGVKAAFATGQLLGRTTRVFAVPIAEPGGGAAAVETITVTGPATASGTMTLRIAGRIISVGINVGDSANTIAANIQAAIAALVATLPVTATVAANVVSCTNVTKGANGNDVIYEQAPGTTIPAGVGIAFAQSVAGAGVIDLAAPLAALYDQKYDAIVTSNHTTTDIGEMSTDAFNAWSPQVQNWRFYFVGSRDSLGTIQALATAADTFPIIVVGCRATPSLPVEIAASTAEAWMGFDAPNVNMDNVLLPLVPPTGANAFSGAENQSLLGGGVTTLKPAGSYCAIVRMMTSQTTVSLSNATPISELREPAVPRTTAALADQVAINFGRGLAQATETDDVLVQARTLVVAADRAAEDAGWIKDVDGFLDKITTQYEDSVEGRMLATNPHEVVPPLHQVVVVTTSYQGA